MNFLSRKARKCPSSVESSRGKGPSCHGLKSNSFGSMSADQGLEQVFRTIDTNGDGKISVEELGRVLKSLGGGKVTEREVKIVFKEADSDGDGFISLEEFLRINSGSNSDELKAAFGMFDIDNDGYISGDELHRVLVGLGEKDVTKEDCERMIKGVDADGNGMVDFEEFKTMMAA